MNTGSGGRGGAWGQKSYISDTGGWYRYNKITQTHRNEAREWVNIEKKKKEVHTNTN